MNPLCLAIDTTDELVVEELAQATQQYVGVFKVGATTFAALGPPVVTHLAATHPVFCDLKLNDIPSQVEGAIGALSELDVSYATIHSMGGREMVRAAASAASEDLKILAVTVLTSLEADDLAVLGIDPNISDVVLRLAEVALEAGAAGLVCSGHEVAMLRARFGPVSAGGPILVVPGIRLDPGSADDQLRTFEPRAALDAGADLLVVGRPITRADDPEAAARSWHDQLSA
jgi:orotidine-5'-phosphate decarboxylase